MSFVWRMAVGFAVLAACGDNATLLPVGNGGDSRVYRAEIPLESNQKFDILFVIDNSPAMAPFASKLAANEREMMRVLTPLFGPDLHVGVVTTDPADAGRLRETASVAGSYVTTTIQFDFTVQANVTGATDDAFIALADVGSSGSATLEPIAMAQAALAPGANPGFLRQDAHLGIVIITAGDDSSPGAVADYATAFKQLKSDPTDVVISVASGPCNAGSLSAPDAPRLTSFLAQFPNRATQVPICADSFAGLVSLEFQLIKFPLAGSCVNAPLKTPFDCAFWLEHPATSEQLIIEPCPSNTIPCWSFDVDPLCSAADHLSHRLVPGILPEAGVVEEIQCVAE